MDKQQLIQCPFCGHDTPEFERLGTPRQSCIVVCGNCGCRHESSDEGEHNGASWNDRAPSPGVDAFPSSGDNAWKDLFWRVAGILKCWPSTLVDDNEHVLRAAARAMSAPSPAASALDPHPPTRHCMCADCKPSFAPDVGWWQQEAERKVDDHVFACVLYAKDKGSMKTVKAARAALLAHLKKGAA